MRGGRRARLPPYRVCRYGSVGGLNIHTYIHHRCSMYHTRAYLRIQTMHVCHGLYDMYCMYDAHMPKQHAFTHALSRRTHALGTSW